MVWCVSSVCAFLRHAHDGLRRHAGVNGVVMATDDARRERCELQ